MTGEGRGENDLNDIQEQPNTLALLEPDIHEAPELPGFHPARFWAKVQKTQSCWLWTGATDKGQGRIRINGKVMVAHRVSWIIAHGDNLGSKAVLHSCGVLSCVNPAHLSLGKTYLLAIAKAAAIPPAAPLRQLCKEPGCGQPRWRRSNWCGAHQNPETRTPLRCIAPKGGRRSKSAEKCGAILGWANDSGYCSEHRYLVEVDRTKHPRPTKPCIEPGCTTRHTCKGDYCRAHRHLSPKSRERVRKFMARQRAKAERLQNLEGIEFKTGLLISLTAHGWHRGAKSLYEMRDSIYPDSTDALSAIKKLGQRFDHIIEDERRRIAKFPDEQMRAEEKDLKTRLNRELAKSKKTAIKV